MDRPHCGFDPRVPAVRISAGILATRFAALGIDARIHVVHTYPTASLPKRAARLAEAIAATARGNAGPLHLIGHSSGGLDARLFMAPEVALPTSLDVPTTHATSVSVGAADELN